MAAFLAPPAFVLAFALLGKVADEPVHRLAGFELQAVDIPQPLSAVTDDDANVVRLFERTDPSGGAPVTETGGDAGRALSEALAALRRSLR